MPLPKRVTTAAGKALAKQARGPVWEGPAGQGPQGGVTYSLLARWLSCRERFRLYVVEGWKPAEHFEPKLEYGQLWHAAEEALAASKAPRHALDSARAAGMRVTEGWQLALDQYAQGLMKKYPYERDQISHWHGLAAALFPEYVKYWAEHPDVVDRTPLLQEQVFDVPYQLPSGRTVRLRGKWDAVDLVGNLKRKAAGIWVGENKSKSGIDAQKIERQVRFDLQTMIYLIALTIAIENELVDVDVPVGVAILGVRYNVVRRPAHKSVESAMKKFGEDQRNGRIGEWFARWEIEVGPADVARFRRECLDPILENVLDDYEWWEFCADTRGGKVVADGVYGGETRRNCFPHHCPRHFRLPFGVYNPIAEGGFGDLDAMMDGGSTAGMRRVETLFTELQ